VAAGHRDARQNALDGFRPMPDRVLAVFWDGEAAA
jgi:hypothetical protein